MLIKNSLTLNEIIFNKNRNVGVCIHKMSVWCFRSGNIRLKLTLWFPLLTSGHFSAWWHLYASEIWIPVDIVLKCTPKTLPVAVCSSIIPHTNKFEGGMHWIHSLHLSIHVSVHRWSLHLFCLISLVYLGWLYIVVPVQTLPLLLATDLCSHNNFRMTFQILGSIDGPDL